MKLPSLVAINSTLDPLICGGMKRIAEFVLAISVLLSASSTTVLAEDTGIVVREHGMKRGSIYWWDNDSLLVAGVQSGSPPNDNSGWRLLRYRLSDKSVTDMGQVGALCVSSGYIRLSRLSADSAGKTSSHWKFILYSGSIDTLVEDPPRPLIPPSPNPPSFSDLSNCKFPDELPVPEWLRSAQESGRIFKALKPEHGWLEMGYADAFDSHHQRTYPLAIHPPGSEDKPLPIDQRQFRPWFEKAYSLHLLRYEPFKNAYLLAAPNGMDGHKDGALWWLYSDGRLEEFLKFKQQGEWSGVSYRNLIPTARDMLVVATKTPPQQNWGLYRVNAENRLELVVKGWAEGGGKAVSPDGCKVAFGIDPRGYPNSRYQLQVVDVCEQGLKGAASIILLPVSVGTHGLV